MAANLLRLALLIGIVCLPLAGCAGMLASKGDPLAVGSISGSSLELKWTGSEKAEGATLTVYDAGSGAVVKTVPLAKGIKSTWVRDLEKGNYRFELKEMLPENAVKDLGSRKIEVMSEKSSRLLTPEDFGLAVEDRLGLTTLIAVPELTVGNRTDLEAFGKAREELFLVSRTLTQFFIGAAFCIESEDRIDTIERVRKHLQMTYPDLELSHGYAASALLAVDLRLPDPTGGIPCQLSIRLFEISHPQYADERIWNRRPLLFEDFIEVPAFKVGKASNYEALIKAYREGMEGLCADPAVQAYCAVVTGSRTRDAEFYERLWNVIGRTIPAGGEGEAQDRTGEVQFARVEKMMFPEAEFVPPAITEEPEAPPATTDPKPEETPAAEPVPAETPAEDPATTSGTGTTEPEAEPGGDPAETSTTDPAATDPAATDPGATDPAKKPEKPAKKPFFQPKKGGSGTGKSGGSKPESGSGS